MNSGVIGSRTAASPGGTGPPLPQAAAMSQPWTVIGYGPGGGDHPGGELAVTDGDQAARVMARGAGGQQPGRPAAQVAGLGRSRGRRSPAPGLRTRR